jgi:hypothetical protein
MPLKGTPSQRKAQVFKEFKAGTLNSGKGGPIVKNPKQAIAIALSQTRKSNGSPRKR